MTTFFKQFCSSVDKCFSIIIEDDGRVAYAYLLKDKELIGDVWLYNQAPSPKKVDWQKGKMPFLNPEEFIISDYKLKPIMNESEVRIDWIFNLNKIRAYIHIHNECIALLEEGAKPGWSRIVVKNGPLAKIMQ